MYPKNRLDLSKFTPEEKKQRKNALERERRARLKSENPEAYDAMLAKQKVYYDANRETIHNNRKEQLKRYRAENREAIAERERVYRENVRKPALTAKVDEIVANFEMLPEGSRQAFAKLLLEVQQYQDSITERALRTSKVDQWLAQYCGH